MLLSVWLAGCHSTTESLLFPGTKINRAELNSEVKHFLVIAEQRTRELDQKEALKNALFNFAITSAQTGTINPIALLMTFGTILGVGATADNIRNRIKTKKTVSDPTA
ncbi:MAG: hypothetical protein E3J94_03640 [Desulfobacteraceae bacterium]|nr:MAG: hypothetical protein E3J94_03640 [Desulfobacteraceae bacterium]